MPAVWLPIAVYSGFRARKAIERATILTEAGSKSNLFVIQNFPVLTGLLEFGECMARGSLLRKTAVRVSNLWQPLLWKTLDNLSVGPGNLPLYYSKNRCWNFLILWDGWGHQLQRSAFLVSVQHELENCILCRNKTLFKATAKLSNFWSFLG